MSWTDEKVELLRQLWLDGRSASQISAALGQGLTRNAVIGKVHRLGLAGRAKTPSPASPGSGTPRAAPPRRMAPRAASGGSSGGGGGSGGSGGHMVHGNTVMALMHDTVAEGRISRVKEDVVVRRRGESLIEGLLGDVDLLMDELAADVGLLSQRGDGAGSAERP